MKVPSSIFHLLSYLFSSCREFDVKALCEGAGDDPDEEELSPDSACSAESPASHRERPHDRESHYTLCLECCRV